MSRSKEHRPNGAAAEGGRPIVGAAEGGASVFFVSAHFFYEYLWMFLIYSIYIYICLKYFPYFFLFMFRIFCQSTDLNRTF